MKKMFFILFLTQLIILNAQKSEKKLIPLKISEKITVDGLITEESWKQAMPGTDFVEFEPQKGIPAHLKTEVRVIYDDLAIYFAITCWDNQPDKLISRMSKRDSELSADDSIQIALDTFHDRQSAYFFHTNILGTQVDGRISDNGRTTDLTWDTEWHSAAKKTAEGWTVEIAIPFAGIKYKSGKDRTWGLGIIRYCPRRLAVDCWNGNMEFAQRVSQFGELAGLDLPSPQKPYEVIPYLISRFEENRQGKIEAGLDARYAFSQSASANLTINPDFATIEADEEQINLTRFELNLAEKRNFFQEGSEIYSQRISLFYSRRISDISGGLKIYGKSNAYEYSGMTAQSNSIHEQDQGDANFSIIRFKKNLFKSSSIGILAANKLINGKNYGDFGLDTTLFFNDQWNFSGQFAISYGQYQKQNIAFFLRPSYDSSTSHFHLRYTQLGENFAENANQVGFIPDDNRRELDSAIEKKWFLKKFFLEKLSYLSNYNIFWGINRVLRSWEIEQEFEFDFRNKFSLELKHIQTYKMYEKEFNNTDSNIEIGYNTREWQSVQVNYEFGRNFDANFRMYEFGINHKLGNKFSLEYELTRFILDPDPEKETTWIHILKMNYFFNNDLFLKFFYQLNSSIEKKNIQIVFVYRFKPPFGLVQLAYQQGSVLFGEKGKQNPMLFIKIAYVF